MRFVDPDTNESTGDGDVKTDNASGYKAKPTPEVETAKEVAKEELSHRERGNIFFKKGKLRDAIAAYKESFSAGEDGWILALSNRAICHLKLKEYDEAVSVADQCIEQDGPHEVPLKVHLTKFKAQAELRSWVEAFATLRKLRLRHEVPCDVEAAATQEERTRRQQYVEELSSSDEEEEDEEELFSGEHEVVSKSLARAVKAIAQEDLKASSMYLIGANGEQPDMVSAALNSSSPEVLAPACDIRALGRDEACQSLASDSPDLVVLCRPNLSRKLEEWVPLVQALVRRESQTIVTGFSDQSLVQNEDILGALGCTITSTTTCCFHDGASESWEPHPHHHALAFKGGSCPESLDLQSLKQTLIDRGFDIPALAGLD